MNGLKMGLINDSFFTNFSQERDFSHIIFAGEIVLNLRNFLSIHKLIEDIPHMTLDEEAFNRMKKVILELLLASSILLKQLLHFILASTI